MSKKTYIYNGPVTSATVGNGEGVSLHPGVETALPADDEYVQTLVALGRLTEVPKKEKPKAVKPKTSVKEEVNNDG